MAFSSLPVCSTENHRPKSEPLNVSWEGGVLRAVPLVHVARESLHYDGRERSGPQTGSRPFGWYDGFVPQTNWLTEQVARQDQI